MNGKEEEWKKRDMKKSGHIENNDIRGKDCWRKEEKDNLKLKEKEEEEWKKKKEIKVI